MSFFLGLNLMFMVACNVAVWLFDNLGLGLVFLGCQVGCLVLSFLEEAL